jgi:hypothetical protein
MTVDTPPAVAVRPRPRRSLRKWFRERLGRIRRAPRRTKAAWSGIVAAVLLVVLSVIVWRANRPQVLRIAYVGRDSDTTLDELHRIVLTKYVSELNARLTGVRFEVVPFDIKKNPARLRHFYRDKFAPDPRYVVAIDNTWGRDLEPSASTIRGLGLPVIAINADKRGADFGGHALFFGHSDNVPANMAAFVTRVLKKDTVTFIAEADYDLTNVFRRTFARSGISLEKEFYVANADVAHDDTLRLFGQLGAAARALDRKVIVLNLHGAWGARTLKFLDDHVHGATFVGGSYVAAGMRNFRWSENGNQMLLLTDPNDALPERIFTEIRSLRDAHPDVFNSVDLNVPLYVKRCLDAVSVIEAVVRQPGSKVRRSDFVAFFRGLRGRTLETPYDLYSFDDALLLQNELTWERHVRGKIASYRSQLNRAGTVIPNVNFGIEVLDITNLNFSENTFDAELYYWFTSDSADRTPESLIHFRNVRRETTDRLLNERHRGNTVYRLYRKSGTFAADFDLRDFPLDHQELVIGVDVINPSDSVRISFDYKSFAESRAGRGGLDIPAWNVRDTYVSVDNLITSSLRGDPAVDDGTAQKFKTLNVRVNVKRRFVPPFIGYVLPLVMIGAVAIALLFLHDISFGTIGDVSVGVFLSIVTYSISYATMKPESSVLTKADFLFYATFLTVLTVFLLLIVVNSGPDASDRDAPLAKRVRLLRYVLAVGYVVAIVAIPLA